MKEMSKWNKRMNDNKMLFLDFANGEVLPMYGSLNITANTSFRVHV